MKWLVFDISNMLYRTFFGQTNEDDETLAGLATHSALVTLNKYFKQYKPDKVVMAFDRSSWRKEYTRSEKCISRKPYKGNRRKDMTEAQEAKYMRFINHIREFEALIDQHTTIITLMEDGLEADDLIAGFCQQADEDDEIIIISTDSDLLQLTRHANVQVISPATDKPQSLDKYEGNPELYLFTKCIRGDATDNIQSAFPGVRMTRIRKAFDDDFEKVQLMKETWSAPMSTIVDGEVVVEQRTFTVGDLFEENRMLIDLQCQPEDIRELLDLSVKAALLRKRQFSMFFFLKFVGKYKLVRVKESLEQYIPMLSR